MKRIILFLLIVSLLALCMGNALAETDVTGKWYLTDVTIGDFTLASGAVKLKMEVEFSYKTIAYIVINNDGNGENLQGRWTADQETVHVALYNGGSMDFSIGTDILTLDNDGLIMIFRREKPTFVFPMLRMADYETEFFGVWKAEYFIDADNGGYMYPVSMAKESGLDTWVLNVSPGKAVIISSDFQEEYATEYNVGHLELENERGILYLTDVGDINYAFPGGSLFVGFKKCASRVSGDVTGDGAVDIMDVIRLLKYVSRWDVEVVEANADVTGDGVIDIMDVIRLLKAVSGWEVELV